MLYMISSLTCLSTVGDKCGHHFFCDFSGRGDAVGSGENGHIMSFNVGSNCYVYHRKGDWDYR